MCAKKRGPFIKNIKNMKYKIYKKYLRKNKNYLFLFQKYHKIYKFKNVIRFEISLLFSEIFKFY